MTYNTDWTIFDPTIIGIDIDPTVGHKASLEAFNCKVGALMCKRECLNFEKQLLI